MSRAAVTYPDKDDLRKMSSFELEAYIQKIRQNISWRSGGPVVKFLTKRLEVAEKVRASKLGIETQSDE